MDVPPALVAAFPPSADLLLDVARRQVDDEMLREIAEEDYGDHVEEHLAALRPIRDLGIVPAQWEWHPAEVLRLMRWSGAGSAGRRGHRMRIFAYAALLRRANEEPGVADEATLAQCLVSARVLGEEFNEAAGRFLAWAVPHITLDDRWLFALGLLIVAVRLRAGRIADRTLGKRRRGS
jgi:hypothetical protein